MVRYKIQLSESEIEELNDIISRGTHSSQTFRAAYILLNSDEGKYAQKVTNKQICKVLKIGMRTIDRVKKRYVQGGLNEALNRRSTTRVYEQKVDEELERKLIKLCRTEPPKGSSRWSLRLLARKMVELDYVDTISHVTVGEVLKKLELELS